MRGESLTFLGAHEDQVADPVIEAHFCPSKRLGELLVFEHTILDGQDTAHVEMFDAC
jgi:hypothetical protein